MERQRYDEICLAAEQQRGELLGKPGGQCQLMTIFEKLNQAVGRKLVGVERVTGGKMRHLHQTGATAFAMGGGHRALRAAERGHPGQVVLAGGAEQIAVAVGAAK